MTDKDDIEKGEAEKDAAMSQVDAHANEAWKAAADHAVFEAAKTNETFTTDAVVPLIDPNTSTHDLRALGPRMTAAARAGWIEKAYILPIPTARRHMTPLTVWRSLIYGAPGVLASNDPFHPDNRGFDGPGGAE